MTTVKHKISEVEKMGLEPNFSILFISATYEPCYSNGYQFGAKFPRLRALPFNAPNYRLLRMYNKGIIRVSQLPQNLLD